MNWFTEHFSLLITPATLEPVGEFSLFEVAASWWADEYWAVHFALLGFAFDFAFWPRGKYDETDGAGV